MEDEKIEEAQPEEEAPMEEPKDEEAEPKAKGSRAARVAQIESRKDALASEDSAIAKSLAANNRQAALTEADTFYETHPTREDLEKSFAEADAKAEGAESDEDEADEDEETEAEEPQTEEEPE